MAYQRGATDLQALRAENTRLRQENRALVLTHTKERKQWAKQAGERLRLLEEARSKADKILTSAYAKAKTITLEAENQADYVRERAYDWGLARADRDYVSKRVRDADDARARETVLGSAA